MKIVFHLRMLSKLPIRYWMKWFKSYRIFKRETLDKWDEIKAAILKEARS